MAKYLYNGIELPALPEWDRTAYPYALMKIHPNTGVTDTYTGYGLFVFSKKVTKNTSEYSDIGWGAFHPMGEYGAMSWTYCPDRGDISWVYGISSDSAKWGCNNIDIVWTNFDLYDVNTNELLFKASDPVPVTTPQDFYITKNGVGQKQDVYLRVGGQSVKLDEYLI